MVIEDTTLYGSVATVVNQTIEVREVACELSRLIEDITALLADLPGKTRTVLPERGELVGVGFERDGSKWWTLFAYKQDRYAARQKATECGIDIKCEVIKRLPELMEAMTTSQHLIIENAKLGVANAKQFMAHLTDAIAAAKANKKNSTETV